MENDKKQEPPKMPPSWAEPAAWHNWEDAMVRYQDNLSWHNELDYVYPTNDTGYDTLFPMDDDDIDALERYAG